MEARGVVGDRGYALWDPALQRVASAKNPRLWGDLLAYRARYTAEPRAGEPLPPLEDPEADAAGFATLDLRGEYRLNREWRVQTRLANLLDADYQTAEGFNQPGQAVYLTVRYQAL